MNVIPTKVKKPLARDPRAAQCSSECSGSKLSRKTSTSSDTAGVNEAMIQIMRRIDDFQHSVNKRLEAN